MGKLKIEAEESNLRKMTLPVAVGVAIIGCVLAVSANATSGKMHQDLIQERYKRMVAEEQLQQAKTEINRLNIELSDAKSKMESIEKILNKGRSKATNLESQVEKLNQERKTLIKRIEKMQEDASLSDLEEKITGSE